MYFTQIYMIKDNIVENLFNEICLEKMVMSLLFIYIPCMIGLFIYHFIWTLHNYIPW